MVPDRCPHYACTGFMVERDFDMAKELLDALESKLLAAVDSIDSLRREVEELKNERRMMEDKLRSLIGRIDQVGGEPAAEPPPDQHIERPVGSYNGPSANPYNKSDSDF